MPWLLTLSLGGGMVSPASAAPSPPVLRELGGVDELAAVFDRDKGVARVVLLLSPT